MSQGDHTPEFPGARQIDAICDRFEQAWLAGSRPPIEEYLGSPEGPARAALLRGLLKVELSYRRRTGEAPTVDEYLARFPGHAQVIAELLQSEREDHSTHSLRRDVLPESTLPFLREEDSPREGRPGPKTLDMIGRFRLERVLGEGGFGTVYQAYDPLLERRVALKVPRFGRDREEELLRFLSEAKTAAQLKHPNIVAVFETGRAGSHYFIVSEFVEGVSLARHLASERPDFRIAAHWMAELAEALQYAHREGIIHRDIKPANIMLDSAGRTQLTDFGLAKRLSEDATLTIDGAIMGTPAYMAPEQARGDTQQIGPHSDQYSLGVVLYELLTGRLPFRAPGMSLLNQIITHDPPRPCSIRREIPGDLEAICLRTLEKDSRLAWATWGKRHEVLVADLNADKILWRQLTPELPASAPVRADLLAIAPKGDHLAIVGWQGYSNVPPVLYVADVAAQGQWREVARVAYMNELLFSPDGRWLAGHQAPNVGVREWRVWEVATGRETPLPSAGHWAWRGDAVFTADSRRLLTFGPGRAFRESAVVAWDLQGGRIEATPILGVRNPARLAVSPDGRRLAVAKSPNILHLVDSQPESADAEHDIRVPERESVSSAAFADDERTLHVESGGRLGTVVLTPQLGGGGSRKEIPNALFGELAVWDVEKGKRLARSPVPALSGLVFCPGGRLLAGVLKTLEVRLWRSADLRETVRLQGFDKPIVDLVFTRDGRRLAMLCGDETGRRAAKRRPSLE